MFGDIGWAELILIGIVALIVIGPEDLPDMFRQLGRFTAKLRAMSREFSRAMEQAAKDTGVKDVADGLKTVASPASAGLAKAADRFEKWDPLKNAATPTKPVTSGSIKAPVLPAGSIPPSPPLVPKEVVAAATQAPADAVVEAPAEPAVGPATQALYDKKAAKAAILSETAAKLKAIEAAEASPAAQPAAQPEAQPEPAAKKPRAPRKTKKADEA